MFLLTHWHCILPLALIGIGYFVFMRPRKSTKTGSGDNEATKFVDDGSIEALDREFASGNITEEEYKRKKRLLRI